MKIEVTMEDIKNGVRMSCKQCPIALAIQRATGDPNWTVGFGFARQENAPNSIILPESAFTFIRNFDYGHRLTGDYILKPFTFELDILEEIIAQ